jgi:two-component system response regulator MprA
MNERVLVIEDDEEIVRVLKRSLEHEDYLVDVALDGEMGLITARDHHVDLIILDLMLPGMSGLDVCQRLRVYSKVPILILTARDTLEDRVQGLDSGADDYVVKPFELPELLARVRALLRRTQEERIPIMTFSDLILDTTTRQAKRADRDISLSAKEYDLLELFMRNPGRVLTREEIFERVWGYDFGGVSNVLDVYVRYLRQKLERNGEPRLIFTVRSVGYVLRETE